MNLFISIICAFMMIFSGYSLAEDEFLMPDKAFALDHVEVKDKHLLVHWKIADNYYLYKNKISFYSDNKKIKVGQWILPDGELKNDEFFGEIEIYKKELTAQVPISSSIVNKKISITAKTQGCAEAGICYPPLRQQVNFSLTEQEITAENKTKNQATSNENNLATPASFLSDIVNKQESAADINDDEDEFLPAEKAFKISVDKNEQGKLIANWVIAPGYYLYQDRFKFETIPNIKKALGKINYPKAKTKSDDILGTYQTYDKQLSLELPLQSPISQEKELQLKITYQGCADAGLCYPPMHEIVNVDPSLLMFNTKAEQAATMTQVSTNASSNEQLSEQDELANILDKQNVFWVLLIFFGLGLALAFTPCVFPMIPILSGIIAGQGDNITTRKAFTMSVLYVLAMSVTYTFAGVVAGMSGENIQIWFQNPWVLSVFAGIFVLLALSMFGFYELQLPSAIQSKITEFSNKQSGGQYTGVIIMGFLSALIVGPCVAPPLMGVLIYISQTGDPFLGGAALFMMSLGMGVPLIAIGTSAGKFLPRAGGWMDSVKVFFGIMMLGLAVWMLERVLSATIIMGLWALILVYSSIYLGALTPITETTTGWGRFRKSTGIILLIYGGILIIGASKGNDSIFEPLKDKTMYVAGTNASNAPEHADFKTVVTNEALDTLLSQAKSSGKVAMIDYYADWCISCKELEKFTFSDPEVIKTLNDLVLIQADVTVDNDETRQLMKRFKIIGPPAILFFDLEGQELKHFRLVGYKNAQEFKQHVDKVLSSLSR